MRADDGGPCVAVSSVCSGLQLAALLPTLPAAVGSAEAMKKKLKNSTLSPPPSLAIDGVLYFSTIIDIDCLGLSVRLRMSPKKKGDRAIELKNILRDLR